MDEILISLSALDHWICSQLPWPWDIEERWSVSSKLDGHCMVCVTFMLFSCGSFCKNSVFLLILSTLEKLTFSFYIEEKRYSCLHTFNLFREIPYITSPLHFLFHFTNPWLNPMVTEAYSLDLCMCARARERERDLLHLSLGSIFTIYFCFLRSGLINFVL